MAVASSLARVATIRRTMDQIHIHNRVVREDTADSHPIATRATLIATGVVSPDNATTVSRQIKVAMDSNHMAKVTRGITVSLTIRATRVVTMITENNLPVRVTRVDMDRASLMDVATRKGTKTNPMARTTREIMEISRTDRVTREAMVTNLPDRETRGVTATSITTKTIKAATVASHTTRASRVMVDMLIAVTVIMEAGAMEMIRAINGGVTSQVTHQITKILRSVNPNMEEPHAGASCPATEAARKTTATTDQNMTTVLKAGLAIQIPMARGVTGTITTVHVIPAITGAVTTRVVPRTAEAMVQTAIMKMEIPEAGTVTAGGDAGEGDNTEAVGHFSTCRAENLAALPFPPNQS